MTEYNIGGGWGDRIEWLDPKEFGKGSSIKDTFHVLGWKTPLPQVGDTLKAEFVLSWMTFEFVSVKPCGDPPDMFLADVKAIKREMKHD